MENYENIWYLDHPHFAIGIDDQWGEHGYLLFEEKIYLYEVDRKEQTSSTRSPMTITDFLAYAEQRRIAIPEAFGQLLVHDRIALIATKDHLA